MCTSPQATLRRSAATRSRCTRALPCRECPPAALPLCAHRQPADHEQCSCDWRTSATGVRVPHVHTQRLLPRTCACCFACSRADCGRASIQPTPHLPPPCSSLGASGSLFALLSYYTLCYPDSRIYFLFVFDLDAMTVRACARAAVWAARPPALGTGDDCAPLRCRSTRAHIWRMRRTHDTRFRHVICASSVCCPATRLSRRVGAGRAPCHPFERGR